MIGRVGKQPARRAGVLLQPQPTRIDVVMDDEGGAEHRQRACLTQHGSRPGEAHRRIDPVEGVERHDRVETRLARVPVLERRGHDFDSRESSVLLAGDGGELLAELDRDDLEPALGKWHRRLARSAADLE